MKKKIIIFGATGNTGSYLLEYALNFFNKEEYEIIASGRRETTFFSKRGIPYYSVDITKEEDFDKLPMESYATLCSNTFLYGYLLPHKVFRFYCNRRI